MGLPSTNERDGQRPPELAAAPPEMVPLDHIDSGRYRL
jgi:hypothetical protein